MTKKTTWLRLECGVENRMSKEYGPFEYLQIVYNNLTTTDGHEVAHYDPTTSQWSIAKNCLDELEDLGVVFDDEDRKKGWSDIVIWGDLDEVSKCPDCGSSDIDEKIVVNEFRYGAEWDAVTLAVTEPQMQCRKCQFIWRDHRAEKARDALVEHHKSKQNKKE